MGKFDGVLLASDFDNTILNTERPRRTGCPIPPISQRNVEALRYFMDNGQPAVTSELSNGASRFITISCHLPKLGK